MDWKKLSLYLTSLLVFSAVVSCTTNTIYSNFEKIDKEGWTPKQVLSYEFEITDTTELYDISLAVRHNKNYAYSNLWVKLVDENKNVISEDKSFQFKLADKTGQWLGKCSNTYCTQTIIVKDNYSFSKTGNYNFQIQQNMRVDELEHIRAIGLVVTKIQTTSIASE